MKTRKGTGKHAARHRRELRYPQPMPRRRTGWTATPPGVGYGGTAAGMFDVVIVDEASQCGVSCCPFCTWLRKY